ncbi:MAG: patatin-like phospholipase family protein [Acetobacterales bacterium]
MAQKRDPKPVNLALQGGGAHGAFTWGVLDRLLEDGRVAIDGISGTSAGAMNAVVVADGLMRGGSREGARERLREFWEAVGHSATLSPFRRGPFDVLFGNWNLDNSPGYVFMDILNRVASPYELNPFNINPLRDLIEATIDFEKVRSCDRMKVFISATNVETGRVKVFRGEELTADMVLASTCLPFMYQAVEVDGVPYWDGGYMGNPALFPFYNARTSPDIVIVQINPVTRPGAPRQARDILNRVNEITFNSSLLREFRAIDFVARLLEQGLLDPKSYKQVLIHRIEAESELNPLGASSKLNAEMGFLEHLFAIGREAAGEWLDASYEALGKRSTLDIRAMFQGD